MGRRPLSDADIELVRMKSSLLDVVSRRGLSPRNYRNGQAKLCCPFHQEKTPSFFIKEETNQYYCFGCGSKGDVFTFIQEYDGVDFIEAVHVLASESGVDLDSTTFEDYVGLSLQRRKHLLPSFEPLAFPGKRSNHECVPDTVWENHKARSLSSGVEIDWPDYFLPLGDQRIPTINEYALSRFPLDVLLRHKVGGCLSGRYRGRLVLPVFRDNRLMFYQARDATGRSDKDKSYPKYTGPAGQSSGHHLAFLDEAAKHPEVLLCEGWFSALRAGSNAVASFTCNLTDQQVRLLKWHQVQHVCLCFDSDAWRVNDSSQVDSPVKKALLKLLAAGFEQVRCVMLRDGDPDELGLLGKLESKIANARVVSSQSEISDLFTRYERLSS